MDYILTFIEGFASFISPCMLPMIPIYLSYFIGEKDNNEEIDKNKQSGKVVFNSIGFVLGFTIIFLILSIFANSIGVILTKNIKYIEIFFGIVIIILGLNYMEILKFSFLNKTKMMSINKNNFNFIKAVIFGILFSISWTPCIGTFLSSALLLVAQKDSIVEGLIMMLLYSIGMGIPFIISAIFIDKLKSTFRSLTVIAVVPLIFIKPLESWATGSFAALSNFYNSSIGFVMETLIIVSIFMSYLLLRVLRDDGEEIKFDRVSKIKWQDKLYKIDFIRIIIDAFKTKSHTAKYKKEVNLIKDTNSYLTIEWLYVNKFTYAFVGFVLTILLILNMNLITKNSAYTKLGNEFLSLGKLSEEDQAAADEIADFDLDYIEEYKNKDVTKEELAEQLTDKTTGTVDNEAVERIYDKINTVNNSYLKFWHVIIAIVVGAIAYYIPNISLYMKNSVRKMDKENEIMQFQSIILMLMHIDRVDVQTILEWLCRFSYAFREPIATCLNNYEAGAEQALEELKDSVPNKDFQRIVEQLESAVTRIPLKASFDELETERAFFYEKRKDANENLVKRKASIGQVLGFTPMVLLIGGYLVAPLLIVSILQMLNYFGQMSF